MKFTLNSYFDIKSEFRFFSPLSYPVMSLLPYMPIKI